MNTQVPISDIPKIHKPLMGSLVKFGIADLEPRMSFEIIKDVTLESALDLGVLDLAYLTIHMWDFCLVETNGKEHVLTLEPGDYHATATLLEGLGPDLFPLRFRQVRICLDGSAGKWREIMGVCQN